METPNSRIIPDAFEQNPKVIASNNGPIISDESLYSLDVEIDDLLDMRIDDFDYKTGICCLCCSCYWSIHDKLYALKNERGQNTERLGILINRLKKCEFTSIFLKDSEANIFDICTFIYFRKINQVKTGPISGVRLSEMYLSLNNVTSFFISKAKKILSESDKWKRSNHTLRAIVCIVSGLLTRTTLDPNNEYLMQNLERNPDEYWLDLETVNFFYD